MLAFHFPEYLTTPDLRKKYDVNILREILLVGMVIAGGLALANLIRLRNRWLNGTALALIAFAVAVGGHRVPVGDFPDNTPYIGLDWFILDLLGSSMVFILIEKMFPLHRDQPVFRPDWQVDFTHFIVNHLLVGLALVIVNFAIHRLFGWLVYAPLQKWVGGLPFFAELFLVLLVADLVQYWTHRAYHEIPFLWRFHAVHHSAEYMDWMAGSRLHLFELLTTRVSILGVLYVLGFTEAAMNVYIVVVGFQAVFNHANVALPAHLCPGAAEVADRDARLPSLAPQLGARGDRPQLRRPLRLHRLSVRHGGEIGPPLSRQVRRAGRLHAGTLRQAAAFPLHLEALICRREPAAGTIKPSPHRLVSRGSGGPAGGCHPGSIPCAFSTGKAAGPVRNLINSFATWGAVEPASSSPLHLT